MVACKVYGLKPTKIEELKRTLLNKKKGLVYTKKEDENLKFYSELKTKKDKDYEIYNIEIDKFAKYYRKGKGEDFYIYTEKAEIVLYTKKNKIYLIIFMNRDLQKIFETIINKFIKDEETLLKLNFNLGKVKDEFSDYRKFSMSELNHNRIDKIIVSGNELSKTQVYKDFTGLKGFIGKILVIHNQIYTIEIFYDGSFDIKKRNLDIEKRIKIIFEIIDVFEKNKLLTLKGWNQTILEF